MTPDRDDHYYCRWVRVNKSRVVAMSADGTITEALWALWLEERSAFTAQCRAEDKAILANWQRSVSTQRALRECS